MPRLTPKEVKYFVNLCEGVCKTMETPSQNYSEDLEDKQVVSKPPIECISLRRIEKTEEGLMYGQHISEEMETRLRDAISYGDVNEEHMKIIMEEENHFISSVLNAAERISSARGYGQENVNEMIYNVSSAIGAPAEITSSVFKKMKTVQEMQSSKKSKKSKGINKR
ncbi:hypothetical protein PROFUN_05280 [Planoprotostelium fungivorum]|uniref:Uncharacterized protein n=1 Tax=Planoprotostelium fungivorum TaxID=1890364 RepID=A0A2P6NRI4_9EUKA|nr:hypothetical protein PROFUN_05280 [Planoprotostelium fungivorum]